MFIPIESERVRGVDRSKDFLTIYWHDATVGVLSWGDLESIRVVLGMALIQELTSEAAKT